MIRFTYQSYAALLDLLKSNQYRNADYHDWAEYEKCVILRHDVDTSPELAEKLAGLERDCGWKSTYFVLLTSDFYNLCSRKNQDILRSIRSMGHEIGLHFDETVYPEDMGNGEKIIGRIEKEANILSRILGEKVTTVSMHRPSREILDADLEIPGLINSYSRQFFREFKYLSDSHRRWREPAEEIIRENSHQRLHILTHAFWYRENEEDIGDTVGKFVGSGNYDRYRILNENITDLSEIMDEPCRPDGGYGI